MQVYKRFEISYYLDYLYVFIVSNSALPFRKHKIMFSQYIYSLIHVQSKLFSIVNKKFLQREHSTIIHIDLKESLLETALEFVASLKM